VIEKLLPLLHLALEDGAQIGLLANDVRREHEDEVRLLRSEVLRERKSAPSTGMSPESGIFVSVLARGFASGRR
jgi:hypothetical protein